MGAQRAGQPAPSTAVRRRLDLEHKIVLITGAARGIGAETARQLITKGAQVALVDRDSEQLDKLATELGPRAACFMADVTDPCAVEGAVAAAVERFGGLDVVVANAGVGTLGTIEASDPADFEHTIEVNLMGVWRTMRATLPHVIKSRGYVLVVASGQALIHLPLGAAYNASKAGVEALADTLRQEVAHHGVGVGVAYLGSIETEMTDPVLAHPAWAVASRHVPRMFKTRKPAALAAAAMVRGIQRRARWVAYPRWNLALLAARGPLQPLTEALIGRDTTAEAVRLVAEQRRDSSKQRSL